MPGVRTELVFEGATGCPVADASSEIPGPVTDINWTDDDEGPVTEQVRTTADPDVEEFAEVFEYGDQTVYEFERATSEPCICEHIQMELGPVTDVYAADGDLHVTLHATDVAGLRDLLDTLREQYGSVGVEYLVRSVDGEDYTDLVPVDLRTLTSRQREVLETAHRLGYFEYPRDANATAVADELGIQPSTFAEHLAAAQRKLLDELLED
jgi:predicted DNA binding protein